jgi:hypothetical protein
LRFAGLVGKGQPATERLDGVGVEVLLVERLVGVDLDQRYCRR